MLHTVFDGKMYRVKLDYGGESKMLEKNVLMNYYVKLHLGILSIN